VISAQNTIMTAIQAAEAEAYDYLPKPFDLPDLMKRAARALDQKRRVAPRKSTAPARGDTVGEDLPLVGRTAQMQALYRLVARVLCRACASGSTTSPCWPSISWAGASARSA
jgi:two-component system nitrogen regulation response regulator GlnG